MEKNVISRARQTGAQISAITRCVTSGTLQKLPVPQIALKIIVPTLWVFYEDWEYVYKATTTVSKHNTCSTEVLLLCSLEELQ